MATEGPVIARPLPPAAERSFPAPGDEEAATRLAPGVVPAVTDSSYTFQRTQDDGVTPVAWSPCRPIHYVVNPIGAPPAFVDHLTSVVAEVSSATGLVFVDDGFTDETPVRHRPDFAPARYGDRWAPVLISFATPGEVADLATAGGLALTSPAQASATGTLYWVSGWVYLNTDLLNHQAVDGSPAYVPVLRHELGHLVGLDHVNDPTQLMYAGGSHMLHFQPGDLTGLAVLGNGACAPGL